MSELNVDLSKFQLEQIENLVADALKRAIRAEDYDNQVELAAILCKVHRTRAGRSF